jgi:glycerate kinase
VRVVIAPDSFKEACSAREAAEAMARGWQALRPEDVLTLVPMADGGEGTVEAVAAAWNAAPQSARVTGPLGTPVDAAFAWNAEACVAVMDMAAASGLGLVPLEQRDPRITTTRGTGELIAHALDMGARRIILGIGGSATNDGGAGALSALGVRFLDDAGRELPPGGAALARLHTVDTRGLHPGLRDCALLLACDVDNPLCGAAGASMVYGPQKGASHAVAAELDNALAHYADVVEMHACRFLRDVPGAGAAGGLAFGLMALSGAALQPGGELVAQAVELSRHMEGAGLVITGEGRFDEQSLHGKTVSTVAALARAQGVPVAVLAGSLAPGMLECAEAFVALRAVTPRGTPRNVALRDTLENLERAGMELALMAWERHPR